MQVFIAAPWDFAFKKEKDKDESRSRWRYLAATENYMKQMSKNLNTLVLSVYFYQMKEQSYRKISGFLLFQTLDAKTNIHGLCWIVLWGLSLMGFTEVFWFVLLNTYTLKLVGFKPWSFQIWRQTFKTVDNSNIAHVNLTRSGILQLVNSPLDKWI